MRIIQVFTVVFGMLLLSGCGDQFWCGENGCPGKDMTLTATLNLLEDLDSDNKCNISISYRLG